MKTWGGRGISEKGEEEVQDLVVVGECWCLGSLKYPRKNFSCVLGSKNQQKKSLTFFVAQVFSEKRYEDTKGMNNKEKVFPFKNH